MQKAVRERMITHIVGNRPQFIKLAALYHELDKEGYEQNIIHSGQHYDENMSDVFFQELDIPKPYINLAAGGGSHAQVTAKAMIGLEEELLRVKPSLVILYGDTNTTLAGAVVAAKLCIPIAHVEAGPRVHHKSNPEECNRIATDHLSDILFSPDEISIQNLRREGLAERACMTGDIMYDTYLAIAGQTAQEVLEEAIVMTWHRQENTADRERMESILQLVERLGEKVICPMHPRTKKCLQEYGLWERAQAISNLEITEPVGYVEMVKLMQRAKLILTDSGGVSKESSYAGAKCLFMLDVDVWEDLVRIDWLHKVNPQSEESVADALRFASLAQRVAVEERPKFYGNGHAASKMVQMLRERGYI
ncbi:MAG: UDP-N-acetylglucosamine 2-epimerase (non-hydrolyzing) [Lachnospiraceae bacterium]|nr:UDP-N-acetylglucosamine 2-epimerase (non-hydrolyzing) [Lachnospiraceae bacterium]